MPSYHVHGLVTGSGQAIEQVFEAVSPADAAAQASQQGIRVSRVLDPAGNELPLDAPVAAPAAPPRNPGPLGVSDVTPAYGPPPGMNYNNVKIPILISAIGNVIFGMSWLASILFACVGIAMIVLCVFEFILFAKADRMTPAELGAKTQLIAIFEIIVGLTNLVSLVCGIIALVNSAPLRAASAGQASAHPDAT